MVPQTALPLPLALPPVLLSLPTLVLPRLCKHLSSLVLDSLVSLLLLSKLSAGPIRLEQMWAQASGNMVEANQTMELVCLA